MAISTKPVVIKKLGIQFITELAGGSTGICPFFGEGGGGGEMAKLNIWSVFLHSQRDATELITSYTYVQLVQKCIFL